MKKLLNEWRKYIKELELDRVKQQFGEETDKKLIFNTDEKISFKNVNPKEQKIHTKPVGLWYSCGLAWLKWAAGEMPGWADSYSFIHELEINPSEMIIISNVEQFEQFEQKYKIAGEWKYKINWPQVAQDYAGIEICPYIGPKRRSSIGDWYYGWDVASGCIWNQKAVKSIKTIYSEEKAPPLERLKNAVQSEKRSDVIMSLLYEFDFEEEMWLWVAKHGYKYTVAAHSEAPTSVLKVLANDEEEYIRKAAKEELQWRAEDNSQ